MSDWRRYSDDRWRIRQALMGVLEEPWEKEDHGPDCQCSDCLEWRRYAPGPSGPAQHITEEVTQ